MSAPLMRTAILQIKLCHNRCLVRDAISLIAMFKYYLCVTHPTAKNREHPDFLKAVK